MATSPSAVSNLPQGYTLEQSSAPQPQQGEVSGLPAGYKLETSSDAPSNTSSSPEDEASQTRQMLVSGLTGLPTPNMTDADKASFARGKAAGAVSVPLVAGATAGALAAPEVVPQIVQKAKAVAEWAKANPIKSVAIAKIADELGIHPFDLMHSVVKYGKGLFGTEDTK